MWRATLKGLLAHKVRLGLTALAIVLGVGFVSGTYLLTDTMNRAFDNLFQQANQGVAVSVHAQAKFKGTGGGGLTAGPPQRIPAALLDSVRQVPGVRDAEGSLTGYAQLVGKDGKAITTGGAPTFGVSWQTDTDLSGADLRQGRAPAAPGEVAVDAATARKHGLHVGDRTKVLLQGPAMEVTIVGIFGFGTADNLGGATVVAFDAATAQTALAGNGKFDTIQVAADPGVSPSELRSRIQKVLPPGVVALTGQQSAAADSSDVKDSLKFFNIALLVFAGIALFVGAFIISNTFSILVTQRTRELALLRALGASPGQVRRSVMAEAAIVGVFASAVGLGFGFLIAVGLQALLRAFGIVLPSTTTQLLPRTVIVAIVVGVGTTFVSSIVPAFRASRVAPVAAMREAEPQEYRPSRRRTLIGSAVVLAGAGSLLYGLFGGARNAITFVGLGAALVFQGVRVLSPLIARPVARALGAPLPALTGISGKLGKENSLRNPKRTASTASALMIGLALVSLVSIFAASIKASTTDALNQTLKADYIVTSSQFSGFSLDVASRLEQDPRFSAVEEFRAGLMGVNGTAQPVEGVDPSVLSQVAQVTMSSGSFSSLGTNDVLVFHGTAVTKGLKVGDTIPVEFAATGKKTLTVTGIYSDNRLLGSYVVSLGTFETNFTQQLDQFLLVKTAPGTSPAAAKAAVSSVAKQFPGVKLEDQAQFRKSQANQINQVLGLVTALLALAIIIALFGIVNTLALSIFERTREIGLLRAVGLSRRQTRAMIRWEAVMIAVFGALLGTAVGVFFGWAMVKALKDQGLTSLSFPIGQLVTYVVIAGVFGVIAAVLPARRAARLDVLRAITTE
ncbi:MAG TPA: FtsX-like permease family protein [Actinomycetota bacterium]|nr:FtsX-like permease family protein [Actinomycetota bacterium]